MSAISNILDRIFPSRFRVLFNTMQGGFFSGWLVKRDFANLIWYNICDIIADILEDVQMTPGKMSDEGIELFAHFKAFIYAWGRAVLQRLWDNGYCVIGWSAERGAFWIMTQNEYTQTSIGTNTSVTAYDPSVQVYVMRSPAFVTFGMSDRAMCKSWLDFLDDICNSSATVNKRLGALVVASPKNLTNAPTATVLTKEMKQQMEKEIREDYGSLAKQSNLLLLPREMSMQTINLAGLDLRTLEKAKMCILAICDRLKAPANQVAIVDATSSKTLANGGEMREGDRLKYASFRRVFERSFADMGRNLGIVFTYEIEGEPSDKETKQTTGTQIVN